MCLANLANFVHECSGNGHVYYVHILYNDVYTANLRLRNWKSYNGAFTQHGRGTVYASTTLLFNILHSRNMHDKSSSITKWVNTYWSMTTDGLAIDQQHESGLERVNILQHLTGRWDRICYNTLPRNQEYSIVCMNDRGWLLLICQNTSVCVNEAYSIEIQAPESKLIHDHDYEYY